MERIVVVGPSGAGKSTLATTIADALGYPRIELDALWWDEGWTEAGRERFTERIEARLGTRWVVDGNYFSGGAGEVVWPRADTMVWLDLPRRVTVTRVVRRSTNRVVRRTELWNGNRETVRDVLGRDSVVWYVWRLHANSRRRYEAVEGAPSLAHLTWIRLRSPAEVRRWQATLAPAGLDLTERRPVGWRSVGAPRTPPSNGTLRGPIARPNPFR